MHAALDYIAANRSAVEAEYDHLLLRLQQAPPPHIQAGRAQSLNELKRRVQARRGKDVDVELPADAPDVAVWQRSQEGGALLITGNRSSGEGSLDQTIAEQGSPESLRVLTIDDPRRVIRDPVYARECALSLLGFVDRMRHYVVRIAFLSLKPGKRDHAAIDMVATTCHHDQPSIHACHWRSVFVRSQDQTGAMHPCWGG